MKREVPEGVKVKFFATDPEHTTDGDRTYASQNLPRGGRTTCITFADGTVVGAAQNAPTGTTTARKSAVTSHSAALYTRQNASSPNCSQQEEMA